MKTVGKIYQWIALLSFLVVAPQVSHAQFGDARWIGDSRSVLYAHYLPQFRICWDVQLDQRSRSTTLALLFGGNDFRLMKRDMNTLGVENGKDESYIKVEMDAAAKRLNIYRTGYTPKGEELLKSFDIDLPAPYSPHRLEVACCLGRATFAFDGKDLGHADLNPIGIGGDYICYPQLGDTGYEMQPGQRATLLSMKVENYRSPHGVLYRQDKPLRIGHKKHGVKMLADLSHGSMPLLRRTFSLKPKTVESATLTATSRGIYETTLNGHPIDDGHYAPGLSQYNKTHYYHTYDITPLLLSRDTLDVQLAEGWWAGGQTFSGGNWNYFGDQLAFIARMVIRYDDGDSTIITTQPDEWLVADQSKVAYASMFQGEVYDNSIAHATWLPAQDMTLAGHLPTEGGGTQPRVDDYSHFHLQPSTTHVWPFATLHAQSVSTPRPGVFVYDMGQNMAGVPEVRLSGLRKGQRVTFRYAEVLYPDLPQYSGRAGMLMLENIRAAMATDIFISNGDAVETFRPTQTLHGYRYLEITGIDQPLPAEDVRGIQMSSIKEFTADFECSNPLVNRLWSNIQWSMLSNFISIPTDCPQRNERMGWSGDISVFSRTAVNMADIDDFLRKHMQSMRDVQTADGRMPDIAPLGGGFGGLLWGSAGITVPWECWLQYGDKDILSEHYEAMKAYIDYIESHYIDPESGLLVQQRQWGDLGDWLGLEDAKNDKTLLFEAYYIYDLDIMHRTARLLNHAEDAQKYEKRLAERKRFFADTYIDSATGKTIASAFDPKRKGQPIDIQGSYVLPLAFGIVDGELRQKMTDNLVATIERANTTDGGVECPPYSLMTGFVTTAWISRVLSDNGRSDVAYRLLQQESYPSWLYPVTQGATTIWERLNSYTHTEGFGGNNSMNSFNHYSFGAVGQWLINRCLGIERDEACPGFRHFILRPEPDPTGQMTYARGHLDTAYGRIRSSWTTAPDGTITYDFTLPSGTSATLILPGQEPKEIGAGTHHFNTKPAGKQ